MKPFHILTCTLLILFLNACADGGGGGGSGDDSQDGSTINATYSKGPVNGATATLHDSDSNTIAGPVTTTNGSASFTNVTFSGPVYASFAGGSYTDEATGSTVTLDATFIIRSGVINNTATGTLEIIATPLTEIAFQRAEAAAGGANLDLSTVNSFIGIVADEFGLELINLTEVAPTPLANITGTSDSDLYGAVLAAISQQQMNASVTPTSTALSSYISNNVTGIDESTFSAAVNDLLTNVNTSSFITNSIVSAIDISIGTAPALSSISATPATTSAALQFSSDEAGTAYFLAQNGGSTPTAAQVKSGSGNGGTVDGAGSSAASSGINNANLVGLVEGTTYTLYVMVEDASGNQSSVGFASVTTLAPNIVRVPQDYSTIDAAISAADPGDTILVSAGTYSEIGTINISKDLILASTFINTGNQNDVSNTIISGGGSNDLFIVTGGANVRIEGLTIENTRKPITIDAGHGTIRHNVIRNNSSDSISFEGDSSGVAEFNTISNSGDDGIDIDGARGPYLIRGNIILASNDDGMEFRMLDNYVVTGPLIYEVYENLIDGTAGDGIQLIDYPTDNENRREINIHHNYIKNATFAGIGTMPNQMTIRGDLPETYPNIAFMERVFVTNNTIVNNGNGISGGDNFIVLNNIIGNNQLGAINLDGNSRLDYTMFLNNNLSGIPAGVQGSNIIFDDPGLNPDGSLQGGSPAIDAGVSSYSWQGENVLTITTFNGSAPDLGWMD